MQDIRTRLIEATFQEVFSQGYNKASLSNILEKANTKKGSMYHYFPSKKDMVLAMIEEKIENRLKIKWEALEKKDKGILDAFIAILKDTPNWDLTYGCPLGNLLQEFLNEDKEFEQLLNTILDKWKNQFINILQKAKDNKELKEDTNIEELAIFLMSSIQGALLLTKKYTTDKLFVASMNQLISYINSLRVRN
ncbi:TetR/AcrR family transcriptional regulator [Malaciobacter mytili]|uniref:TetR family transcriptional regulator n=1 Tax=Malaciobacter mytili LMG 24559 TaxID=1032238 RepID=A0AAX2AJA5_9BACT|nr:TetR/AcrR family transcriptional regulator [Malaciobacter mytili]AXH14608.1 transcriptional regulator, TetR/AcrR family [Malaciobacter mytili LMG 24559]RXI47469.1 TetR family transcriptional regulator [Malaciobacter mytili]RXK16660.1 TetR family transcriptional regulator [Malaciobacter mytili LMG 24559]